jgi:hypothetical protein
MPFIIAALVFFFICCCVLVFLWVDRDASGARWCSFPFNLVTQLVSGSGACP